MLLRITLEPWGLWIYFVHEWIKPSKRDDKIITLNQQITLNYCKNSEKPQGPETRRIFFNSPGEMPATTLQHQFDEIGLAEPRLLQILPSWRERCVERPWCPCKRIWNKKQAVEMFSYLEHTMAAPAQTSSRRLKHQDPPMSISFNNVRAGLKLGLERQER